MFYRKSRKQQRRPVPQSVAQDTSIVMGRCQRGASGDPTPFLASGRVTRSRSLGDDQPSPPAVLAKRRLSREPSYGHAAISGGRVVRSYPTPDYVPVVQWLRGRRLYNRDVPDQYAGRAWRHELPMAPEVSDAAVRRGRLSRSPLPDNLTRGGVWRTGPSGPDPPAIVSARPFGHRTVKVWALEAVLEGRATRRLPMPDPVIQAVVPRRLSATAALSSPGGVRRGRNFHTGESGPPGECPIRPRYADEDARVSAYADDGDSRPALVEESGYSPPAPIFRDECR